VPCADFVVAEAFELLITERVGHDNSPRSWVGGLEPEDATAFWTPALGGADLAGYVPHS